MMKHYHAVRNIFFTLDFCYFLLSRLPENLSLMQKIAVHRISGYHH